MSDKPEFQKFNSLHRFGGPVYVTEKIDGTNAQIYISEDGDLFAGSRTRWITPDKDNFGFAAWAHEHKDRLVALLGTGLHYGEWWGKGIQRGYGIQCRCFSLFNAVRWPRVIDADIHLYAVPVLYEGAFNTTAFDTVLAELKQNGSSAALGFMNPEGIVVYDSRSGVGFKKTYDYDDTGKGGQRDLHGNVASV